MNMNTTAMTSGDRSAQDISTLQNNDRSDFLSVMIGGQLFGIPVLQVEDVLGKHPMTKVPLAPKSIAGSLNLRGRIVTAINVRQCLGLPDISTDDYKMSVVVEMEGELFSLMIDKVGDVLSLNIKDYENNPPTLDPLWREISKGIYRLQDNLLVVLDVPRLLARIKVS